jgi:hypothetical protein
MIFKIKRIIPSGSRLKLFAATPGQQVKPILNNNNNGGGGVAKGPNPQKLNIEQTKANTLSQRANTAAQNASNRPIISANANMRSQNALAGKRMMMTKLQLSQFLHKGTELSRLATVVGKNNRGGTNVKIQPTPAVPTTSKTIVSMPNFSSIRRRIGR